VTKDRNIATPLEIDMLYMHLIDAKEACNVFRSSSYGFVTYLQCVSASEADFGLTDGPPAVGTMTEVALGVGMERSTAVRSDVELLEGIRAGETRALEALMARYWPPLVRYAENVMS
jgi:hypothetical protein